MWKMDVKGEIRFISCKEDFVQLVEEQMGADAADWLKAFIQEGKDFQEELRIKEAFEEMKDDVVEQMENTLEKIKEELRSAKNHCLSKMWD